MQKKSRLKFLFFTLFAHQKSKIESKNMKKFTKTGKKSTTAPIESPNRLVGCAQVADFINVNPKLLLELMTQDGFPSVIMIGTRKKFRFSDIENWVASQAV